MEPNWSSWLRGLWTGFRFLVAGSRSGQKRLSVAVDHVPDHPHYRRGNGTLDHGDADHVRGPIHRDLGPEDRRFVTERTDGAWSVGDTFTGPVPRNGGACPDCTTRYGSR